MNKTLKKRGQKIVRKISRTTNKVRENSKSHLMDNFFRRFSHIKSIRLLILEWVLLVFAVVMLGVAQAFWYAETYSSHNFVSGGSFIEGTIGRINTLNPILASTSSEKTLSRLLFTPLVTTDYTGNFSAGLAQYITVKEDGKIWTLRLKPNLKWSDGEPITNKDVIFTTELIKNSATNNIYINNLRTVSVKESEAGEIVFTLSRKYADFAAALNFPILPAHKFQNVDPKNLVEADFSLTPVGSGAFKINTLQTLANGNSVVYLARNPYYYLGHTMLDSFIVNTYASKDEIISALNSSEITGTAELSDAELSSISNKNFTFSRSPLSSGIFAFFNTESDNLKNASMRRIIQRAINMDNIRSAAPYTTPLDYPLLKSQIELTKYPEITHADLNSTIESLSKLFPNINLSMDSPDDITPFATLNIVTLNYGYLPAIAQALADELKQFGIDANIATYSAGTDFTSSILSRRNYDILIYEIELGADPDIISYFHSSQAKETGLNFSNYQNTLVDDLLAGARETTNQSLRIKKYEQFLEYFINDVPAIAICQPNLTYIYSENTRSIDDSRMLINKLDRFNGITTWASRRATRNFTP